MSIICHPVKLRLYGVTVVLKPLYHDDMRIMDVIHVLLKAYEEAREYKQFEMPCHGGGNWVESLLLAPVKGNSSVDLWGPKSKDTQYTVEQFYESMAMQMLNDLRFTRVDWMKEELFK